MAQVVGVAPLLPAGTARSLAFASARGGGDSSSWSERIWGRYVNALSRQERSTSQRGPWAMDLESWVFPRAWYLRDRGLRGRGRGVPRWFGSDAALEDASIDSLAAEDGASNALRVAPAMPMLGGFAAANDPVARVWAERYEDFGGHRGHAPVDASANGSEDPLSKKPPSLPASVAHIAWSDAVLARIADASVALRGWFAGESMAAQSTPVGHARRETVMPVVLRSPAPAGGGSVAAPVPEVATPRFGEDEVVSDDVFAAIARPMAQAPGAGRAGRAEPAGPDFHVNVSALSLVERAIAQQVLIEHTVGPGLAVRLLDAPAAAAAPHVFYDGERAAYRKVDMPIVASLGRPERQVREQGAFRARTLVATPAESAPPTYGDTMRSETANPAVAQADLMRGRADRDLAFASRFAPGAQGFAATASAATFAAGAAGFALEFLTPQEANAARAMRLPPTAWTDGVKLAAAGPAAVAARWEQLEAAVFLKPRAAGVRGSAEVGTDVRAVSPIAMMAGGEQPRLQATARRDGLDAAPPSRLPRGAYVWPSSAIEAWDQEATLARAVAEDGADEGSSGGNQERLLSPPLTLVQALQATWSGRALAGTPRAGQSGASLNAPAVAAWLGSTAPASAPSAFEVSPQRPLGSPQEARLRIDDAVSMELLRASTGSDAAARVMAAVTHGMARASLPVSVGAWVQQLETAVANKNHLDPASALDPALALERATAREPSADSVSWRAPVVGMPLHAAERRRSGHVAFRAEAVAEAAELASSYVVPKASGAASRGELAALQPHEIAALLRATPATVGLDGAGTPGAPFGVTAGDATAAAMANLDERGAASVHAGVASMIEGAGVEPTLYEMTMIAALNQTNPEALAARTTNEFVAPPSAAPGAVATPLDVEAEAEAILREVIQLITTLRDRNGEF